MARTGSTTPIYVAAETPTTNQALWLYGVTEPLIGMANLSVPARAQLYELTQADLDRNPGRFALTATSPFPVYRLASGEARLNDGRRLTAYRRTDLIWTAAAPTLPPEPPAGLRLDFSEAANSQYIILL